jgi:hypothetical protein
LIVNGAPVSMTMRQVLVIADIGDEFEIGHADNV